MSEPDIARIRPVWMYSKAELCSVPFDSSRDRPLMDAILDQLDERGRIVAV